MERRNQIEHRSSKTCMIKMAMMLGTILILMGFCNLVNAGKYNRSLFLNMSLPPRIRFATLQYFMSLRSSVIMASTMLLYHATNAIHILSMKIMKICGINLRVEKTKGQSQSQQRLVMLRNSSSSSDNSSRGRSNQCSSWREYYTRYTGYLFMILMIAYNSSHR